MKGEWNRSRELVHYGGCVGLVCYYGGAGFEGMAGMELRAMEGTEYLGD